MKKENFKINTIDEVKKLILQKKKELETFVVNVYKNKEKNLKKGFFLKKEIARLLTALREKEILERAKNA